MNEIPPSIFVPNQTLELEADSFNHCSSVCPYNGGILIAWYSGQGECHDDQSVYLLFIQKDRTSKPHRLANKTGNPVLWRDGDNAYLLWSRFEDYGPINSLADRWKYCSNWMSQLTVQDDEIKLTGDLVALKQKHLLGRCCPISHNGAIYLPLYDEVNRNGVVFTGSGQWYKRAGNIGQNMIQPTLWVENDKICSLSRTFHSAHRHSQYSESVDGKTWSLPVTTSILNHNSSLHALNWHGHTMLLWNDTERLNRHNLTLGVIHRDDSGIGVVPLFRIANIGAYPSMCEDEEGNLCLSYTTASRKIKYHACQKTELLKAIGGRDLLGTRGEDAHIAGRETPVDSVVL